jgi:hypothetical protein
MGNPAKFTLILVLAVCMPGAIYSQVVADPSEYLETARATADIARVMRHYTAYLERNDPWFIIHGDVNIPMVGGIVPADAGDLTGEFQGFDAFMQFRLLRNENLTARVFGIWSTYGFSLDDSALSSYPVGFTEDDRTGWVSGYALVGGQVSTGDNRYTLGAILRYEPTIDTGPPARFSYWYDDEGDFRTSEMIFERVYAGALIAGWQLDTLVSLEAIERMAAGKLYELAIQGLSVGPAVQYLGRLGSLRPGFESAWKPFDWFEAALGANLSFTSGEVGLGEARLDLGFPFSIPGARAGKHMKPRELMIRLDAQGSIIGIDGAVLPGGKIEFTVDNARGLTIYDWLGLADVYLGASVGISLNHAETLARMPFEDIPILYLKIQAALY